MGQGIDTSAPLEVTTIKVYCCFCKPLILFFCFPLLVGRFGIQSKLTIHARKVRSAVFILFLWTLAPA